MDRPGARHVISQTIVAALQRASVELDTLLSDISHNRKSARRLEDVEDRVQSISGGMVAAVRGPDAARPAR